MAIMDQRKSFQRDYTEIQRRSWWLALKTRDVALANFASTAVSTFLPDPRFQERDQRLLFERLAYAGTFVLVREREEIEAAHGWDRDMRKLHLDYQVALGIGFNYAFDIWEREDDVFVELLGTYYDFDCDDDYAGFWNIPAISDDEFAGKSVLEHLAEPLSPDDYNLHRFYTYRCNMIARVTDPARFAENASARYAGLAMEFYEPAFFGLSMRRITRELKAMANK